GVFGFLAKLELLFGPIQLRRYEQIDIEPLRISPVDAVVELGILFDSRSRTAPEGLILCIERLPRTGCEGQVVLRVASLRLDRPDSMIQEGALIVIEVGGVGIPTVEMPREFQHVVRTTALSRSHTPFQLRGEPARLCKPAFAVAGAGSDIGAG